VLDRLQILASRFRHLFSRPRWSRWFLGDAAKRPDPTRPGLILIQVDGLGESIFRDVLAKGQMPFVKTLIERDGYTVRSLYSGLPSSTPAVQGELFYGVPSIVPAFGYRDPEAGRTFYMNDPFAASAIEQRLAQGRRGLLRGGSAWTNIYSGGASEPHLCASTVGVRSTLANLAPRRLAALVLFHSWSIVRVLGNLVIMTLLIFWDLLRGKLGIRRLLSELVFVPARVIVSVAMREVSTAGAEIDAGRGLPIIELNFLGYDEHAHRRGPNSSFARWSLRGIDKSIQRVWTAAHRSHAQDYQVWIYSDHGQEDVVPYAVQYGESVATVVRRLYALATETDTKPPATASAATSDRAHRQPEAEPVGLDHHGPAPRRRRKAISDPETLNEQTSSRSMWTGRKWSRSTKADLYTDAPGRPKRLMVTDKGPTGFVYLPKDHDRGFVRTLAQSIVHEGKIPLVIVPEKDRRATAYTKEGIYRLPDDAAAVFGADHPHLDHVAHDIIRVVHHAGAGDLSLFGWNSEQPLTLQGEWGAHGGPGPEETSAFLLLPAETRGFTYVPDTLRPLQVRQLALRVLGRRGRISRDETIGADIYVPPKVEEHSGLRTARIRVMTYNVHGCRGTDGVFSSHRIARVIARERPDVVCLQELDQVRTRSGGIDQAREIAERLQSEYHFHAVSEMDDGLFGNAVLSLLPIRLLRKAALPGYERLRDVLGLWHRGAIAVALSVGSEEVIIVNTHLSVFPREQRLQAQSLLNDGWLGDDPNRPVLLAGDFNAGPRSQTMKILAETLHNSVPDATARLHKTWTAQLPIRRIDHILHSGSVHTAQIYVPRTNLSRIASDHLPLVADIVCEFSEQRSAWLRPSKSLSS